MIVWAILMAMVLMAVDIGLVLLRMYGKTNLMPGIISIMVVPGILVYGITTSAVMGLATTMMMMGAMLILVGYFTRETGLYLMSLVPAMMGMILMAGQMLPAEMMMATITIGGPTVIGTTLIIALLLIVVAGIFLLKTTKRAINTAIYLMGSGLLLLYLSIVMTVGMQAVAVLSSIV